MRTFNYSEIKGKMWDSDILGLIAAIYKEAGKQEMYLKQRPEELEKLVEIAKVQSTEASNAIEGIVTTSTRIKQLVEEKTTPKNHDEQEIAGYRDVLNIIHESFNAIPITQNYILQLHKILYSHMNNPMAGRICEEYNRVIGNMEVEPLIAIPIFIHDFLCIHPFNDGNGRMSRLLTTLLLYRSGFYVGKYISLEAKIAKNKDLYYDALSQAQTGWHEGTEDPIPFIKYLLGTILAAYRDFEDRFALVETKLPALCKALNKAGMDRHFFAVLDPDSARITHIPLYHIAQEMMILGNTQRLFLWQKLFGKRTASLLVQKYHKRFPSPGRSGTHSL